MDHPFQHPLGKEFLKRVKALFHSEQTYILRDSKIVFVCGGAVAGPSMRARFLKYAQTELPHQRMFLAEDAEKDFVSNDVAELHDVSDFEDIIGEVSDCLIIFPESPGSFAELGYFANNEKLRTKILVVNDMNLQGEDSFILRGPIHKIDTHSKFKQTIQVEYTDSVNFGSVKQRLENRIQGKHRTKFDVKTYPELDYRKTFFAIFEIVRLFEVMTLESIEFAFKSIFAHANPTSIKLLLSILVAAKLVKRGGDNQQHFCIDRHSKPFMEFEDNNPVAFRLALSDFYGKHFPEIADIVRGLA